MAESSAEVNQPSFWESWYARGEAPWDIGQPAPPLARWLDGPEAPPPGQRVAVLGCGRGHEVLLFARAGHRATGFDFAPGAIAEARASAARAGVEAEFVQADLFTLPAGWRARFDLVVEHCCFCAIDPGRRAEYAAVVRDMLTPGGLFVALFYAHGRPGGPPFSTSREEIERLFNPHFAILRLELAQGSVASRSGEELFALMRRRG